MTGAPKFWIVAVAIAAVIGIVFVLVTPAPDELPSTGPHALAKSMPLVCSQLIPPPLEICSIIRRLSAFQYSETGRNLLALTCTRIC